MVQLESIGTLMNQMEAVANNITAEGASLANEAGQLAVLDECTENEACEAITVQARPIGRICYLRPS